MKRIVFELDKQLNDGELLIFKNDKIQSVRIRELLPELKELRHKTAELESEIADLKQTIVDLARIVKEK